YFVAQLYYDSVATVLPSDYTDVNTVRRKLSYMGEITRLFHDIIRKDTLLALSALTAAERDSVVRVYAHRELGEKKAQLARQQQVTKKKGRSTSSYNTQNVASFSILDQAEMTSGPASDQTFYFNNP